MSSMKSVIVFMVVIAMCFLPLMESKPVKESKKNEETPINTDVEKPIIMNTEIKKNEQANVNEDQNDKELVDNEENPLLRPSGEKGLDSKPEISSEEDNSKPEGDSNEDHRPPPSSEEECSGCDFRKSLFAYDVKKTYIEEKKA